MLSPAQPDRIHVAFDDRIASSQMLLSLGHTRFPSTGSNEQ